MDKKVILKETYKIKHINIENITHITCNAYHTTIYTIDYKTITISKRLKSFETELCKYGFIRANYNVLVNVKNIMEFQKKNKRCIILSNKEQVKVSRRKLCLFKEFLK